MTDATMAVMARELAEALIRFARDRRTEDQKDVARLHHLICMEYRNELAAAEAPKENGH